VLARPSADSFAVGRRQETHSYLHYKFIKKRYSWQLWLIRLDVNSISPYLPLPKIKSAAFIHSPRFSGLSGRTLLWLNAQYCVENSLRSVDLKINA
jgi:hypothetical protein